MDTLLQMFLQVNQLLCVVELFLRSHVEKGHIKITAPVEIIDFLPVLLIKPMGLTVFKKSVVCGHHIIASLKEGSAIAAGTLIVIIE